MSRLFKRANLTEKVRSRVVIKLLIAILTLIAVIFVLNFSLEITTAISEIEKENEIVNIEKLKLVLKDQNLEDLDIGDILISISATLSAILAIVFAFSQIILSNISDRYSPYILEKYREDKKTYSTFFIFIVTLLISIFSFIFVEENSNFVKFIIILLLIVLLGSCFCRFIDYSDHVFEIINPLSFVEKLGDDVDKNVEQINEDETKKLITVLGDIAVKSLKRNEDEVVKRILDVKLGIFENFLELRKKEPGKYLLKYDTGERKNITFVYLLNQQLRLFKNAVSLKNDDITVEISDKLFDYVFTLLRGENNMDLIEQILETRYIHGRYFSQFLKEAIENDNISKYFLLGIISNILQINRSSDTKICDDYIENLILTHIFRINQIVIDHDDFDLFRREIDNYSHQLIGYNPISIKKKIETPLYFSRVPFRFFNNVGEIEFFEQRSKDLRSFARFKLHFLKGDYQHFMRLLSDFLDKTEESCDSINIDLQLKNNPDKYRGLTDEGIEKPKQDIKSKVSAFKIEKNVWIAKINRKLYDLYISSILYQTFFGIGWYIVFCKSHKNLDAQKYLKELWEHTRPEDSRILAVNEPPVSFDIEFITQILFYGSGIWGISFDFVDFHDTSRYIYHYYLLLLTYSRIKFRNDLKISPGNRDTHSELEKKYKFMCAFISKGEEGNRTGDFITNIDELIEEADEWNELMNFKERNIHAKDAFISTREWIIRKVEEFQVMKKQIEMRLPIDENKERNCREEILKSYKEASIIHEVVDQKEYDEKEDGDLDFIQIYERPLWPRESFIRVDTFQNPWDDIGRSIANGEKSYFLERILKSEEIKRIEIEPKEKEDTELLFSRVLEAIEELKKDGLNPSLIFIPDKYYGEVSEKSCKSDSVLNGKVNYEDSRVYLMYDKDVRLEMSFYQEIMFSDDIVILDKSLGIWTYKKDEKTGEKLFIDIDEYEENKSKVDLYVRILINLRITNPERARILKFQ